MNIHYTQAETQFPNRMSAVFARLNAAMADFSTWYAASGYEPFQMGMGPLADQEFYANEAYGILMGTVDERNFVGEALSNEEILSSLEEIATQCYTTLRDECDERLREQAAEYALSEPVTT